MFPFAPVRHPLSRADLSLREAASQGVAPTPHKVIPVSPRPPLSPLPLPGGQVTFTSGNVGLADGGVIRNADGTPVRLPGGGAVRLPDGTPVRVPDGGTVRVPEGRAAGLSGGGPMGTDS
jgi:hypothetical protein